MKSENTWNIFSIFAASLATSVLLAKFASPLYEKIFQIYSGSWMFGGESYVGTAALIYVFLISLLYRGLSKIYKGLTLFYFVLIPFLIFSVSGVDVFIAGPLLLIVGIYSGKLIRNRLVKNIKYGPALTFRHS